MPIRSERVSRRMIRAVISTLSVPSSATMKRHPNGVTPNSHSPRPMVHLPSGGWTTKDALSVKMSRVSQGPCWPNRMRVGVLDRVPLEAEAPEGQRILDVVGLVEDDGVWLAQADESQQRPPPG